MRRSISVALRFWPKRWRNRYGREIADLADELIERGGKSHSSAALGIAGSGAGMRLATMSRRHRILFPAGSVLLAIAIALTALAVTGSYGPVGGSRHLEHEPLAVVAVKEYSCDYPFPRVYSEHPIRGFHCSVTFKSVEKYSLVPHRVRRSQVTIWIERRAARFSSGPNANIVRTAST
jgi:hypothetical protein